MHKNTDSASQNAFLQKYITAYSPKRKRPRVEKTEQKPRLNAQYTIPKCNSGRLVMVCAVAFRSIARIGNELHIIRR